MTGPAPTSAKLSRLQTAVAALSVAVAGAVAGVKMTPAPALPPARIVPVPDMSCRFNTADSVLIAQGGDHTNAFERGDTLYYVPLRGSPARLLLDSTATLGVGDSTQAVMLCVRKGVKIVPYKPMPQNENPPEKETTQKRLQSIT